MTATKKKKPAPRVHWDMYSVLMYSVTLPVKDSRALVITFNPVVSPYLIAAETAAGDLHGALAAHKHQLIGPVNGFTEAIAAAEKFGEEWLRGKGFPPLDCTCDDIHPGTKLRPVARTRRQRRPLPPGKKA